MSPLIDLLSASAQRPILSDGGMGTQLFAAGLKPGASPELWNVDHAEAVQDVHRRYRAAGAMLLTTNTFGGSEPALARHGLANRMAELNQAAARNAKAVADGAFVMGDVGPFGGFLEPYGDMTEEELLGVFSRQVQALVEGGVDAIAVETMVDPNEVWVAVRAAKAVCDLPVFATYAFNSDGAGGFRTMMGASPADALKAAFDAGADAAGANCGTDLSLDDYRALAKALMAAADGKPVVLQPNAGRPETVDGRLIYRATPDDMAALAKDLVATGVRVVGGCCGTTPEHIGAAAAALGLV